MKKPNTSIHLSWFLALFLFAFIADPAIPQPQAAKGNPQRPLELPAYLNARKGPWCATTALWQTKANQQAAVTGGCPEQGACDDPGNRDATAITQQTINVIVHVIREDNGSGGISQATINASIGQLNADYANSGTGFQFSVFSSWPRGFTTTAASQASRSAVASVATMPWRRVRRNCVPPCRPAP